MNLTAQSWLEFSRGGTVRNLESLLRDAVFEAQLKKRGAPCEAPLQPQLPSPLWRQPKAATNSAAEWSILQPEEHVAIERVNRQSHLVGRRGTGDVDPVRAQPHAQRIGLRLQLPANLVRRPRQVELAAADH